MKKERWLKTAVVLLAVFFIAAGTVPADDMGTYMTNLLNGMENVGTIHAYQTQERGYVLGGSMSVRVPQDNVSLFSFTPPDIHAGCNGIDLMLGGFSYLNADMIVQTLQKILQAAPFVAFDLALNTLCQPCANAIAKAHKFMQTINSLQLNSCKAAEALTAALWQKTGLPGADEIGALTSKKVANKQVEEGKSSLWAGSLSKLVANLDKTMDEYAQAYQITVKTHGKLEKDNGLDFLKGTTLVRKLFTDWGDSDSSLGSDNLILLTQAIAGDIIPITGKDGHVHVVQYISPPDVPDKLYHNMIVGGAVTLPDGKKVALSFTAPTGAKTTSLKVYVESLLNDVYNKIANGGKLSPAEVSLMDMTTVPVYSYLKLCYMLRDPTFTQGTIQQISPYVAAEMVYFIVSGISRQAHALANSAETLEQQIPGIIKNFKDELDKLIKRCDEAVKYARKFVNDKRKEFTDNYKSFLDDYHQKQLTVNRILRKYNFAAGYALETTLSQETGGVF